MSLQAYCVPMKPGSFPREFTDPRRKSGYVITYHRNLEDLEIEAEKLDADELYIALNVERHQIRRDGMPKSGASIPPPVIVYLESTVQGDLTFPSDRWDNWQDNIRAVGLTLQRLRLIDEAGVAGEGQQYQGWAELPSGIAVPEAMTIELAAQLLCGATQETVGEDWHDVLRGVTPVRALFNEAAKLHHPDHGGDPATFRRLVEARDLLLKEL